MPRLRFSLALLGAALLLTSCAAAPQSTPSPTSAPATAAAPSGGEGIIGAWIAEEINGEPIGDGGQPLTAAFEADGSVAGSGGCNRFRGTYEVTGDAILVSEALATTMMACDETVMATETTYLAALTAARTFAVSGDRLELKDPDGTTTVTFAAQPQTLAGTSWTVVSYNNGENAVVSVLSGSSPSVEFGEDGSVSGSGGCNRFTGTVTAEEGALTFGPLATTQMACADPEGVMEQETAFLTALATATFYTVEGNTLALRTEDHALAVQLTRA